jgi:hypothetical protein
MSDLYHVTCNISSLEEEFVGRDVARVTATSRQQAGSIGADEIRRRHGGKVRVQATSIVKLPNKQTD